MFTTMKKFGITIGLCLLASIAIGQKKAVSDALRLANDSKYADARNKIKEALEHAETKDDAKTWYTAGKIEDMEFAAENAKVQLGQPPNDGVRYAALLNVWPFFKKAMELDKIPDAKGKVKPKYTKDILSIMKDNMPFYINGGGHFFEPAVKDFKKSMDFFDQIIEITDLGGIWPMKKEPTGIVKEGDVPDSTYIQSNFYAAVAAYQLGDPKEAVRTMERSSYVDYQRNDIFQLLSEQYLANEDTVNYEKTLERGLAVFPSEPFYTHHLVNLYTNANKNEKALEYLNMAIKLDPNDAQLHLVSGRVNEFLDNLSEAEENYLKSVELDGENPEGLFNLGGLYFNQGANYLDEISNINDIKKYNEEKEKVYEFFRKALPYFEKAYELKPDMSAQLPSTLRNIYYHLEMDDKLKWISKIMGVEEE